MQNITILKAIICMFATFSEDFEQFVERFSVVVFLAC